MINDITRIFPTTLILPPENRNIAITGDIGSGKTNLLRHILDDTARRRNILGTIHLCYNKRREPSLDQEKSRHPNTRIHTHTGRAGLSFLDHLNHDESQQDETHGEPMIIFVDTWTQEIAYKTIQAANGNRQIIMTTLWPIKSYGNINMTINCKRTSLITPGPHHLAELNGRNIHATLDITDNQQHESWKQ